MFLIIYAGEGVVLRRLLFFIPGSFPQSRIEYFFADAEIFGCHLKKLICVNKVKSLLKAKDSWRCQAQRLIGTGGTRVGKLFFLTYIELNILTFSILTDHHARVNLFAGTDKQGAAFLCVVEPVSDCLACFKCDEGTLLAVLDIPLVRPVSVEYRIQNTVALGVCHKFTAVANQPA